MQMIHQGETVLSTAKTKTMMTKLFLMSYVKNSWTERKYVHIRATLPVIFCITIQDL